MPEIGDSVVLDTGVLLEYLEETPLGTRVNLQIFQNPQYAHFLISPLTAMELFYLVCRKKGEKRAREIMTGFIPLFEISLEQDIRIAAALLKCKHAIALADCYAIAISQLHKIPIFMKQDEEIRVALQSGKLIAEIHFIDDLPTESTM